MTSEKRLRGDEVLEYEDPLGRVVRLSRRDGRLCGVRIVDSGEEHVPSPESIRLLVLGDLHGHLTRGLEKVVQWIEFTRWPVHGILQVGDIGAFDDLSCLDRVTIEMSRKDPEELGFRDYYVGSPAADRFFAPGGILHETPFVFIEGNHDDLEFLRERFPHDQAYRNMGFLDSGEIFDFWNGDFSVRLGAVGRSHTRSDIRQMPRPVDILMSHSPRVLPEALQMAGPRCHLFGHYHDGVFEYTQVTERRYGLNEVTVPRRKVRRRGSLGYLELAPAGGVCFAYAPESYDGVREDPGGSA